MYEIYLDGKTLYYPADELCAATNAKIHNTVGDSGYLDVTIPMTNPCWGKAQERSSIIEVIQDGKQIFYGEVRELGKNLSKDQKIYAVGEMSWLADSIQSQVEYKDADYTALFHTLIDIHNTQVEEAKRFEAGFVTSGSHELTNLVTNYEDTLSVLRKLAEMSDGYLRVRRQNGVRYLDIVLLEDYGTFCSQEIEFGSNLLDYSDTITSNDIATAVIPLGAKIKDGSTIEGVDAFTTIESVNDGKNYLYDEEAVSHFGWIKKVVTWNDVDDPMALKELGQQWLSENQFSDLSITVKAVDLSTIDVNIDSFEYGDRVRVVSKPFGLDAVYSITETDTDLLNFANNSITVGSNVKLNFTKTQAKKDSALLERIPQEEAFLQAAKENASELIKNATEGNIYFINDDNGKPKELLIMDNPDITLARKVWRWNLNGLGYSNTGYDGLYGLAMTMDGAIVADYITVGTLRGITITGNTINGGTINGTTINGSSFNTDAWRMGNSSLRALNGTFDIELQPDGTWAIVTNGIVYTSNDLVVGGDATIDGYLVVQGSKSRKVSTNNYDDRLLYCYEMATPIFGDIGSGVIDESGESIIFIDDIFDETVDSECEYQVFLQAYGNGKLCVEERTHSYFKVCGTAGLEFGWELKAVQKDYDSIRLEDASMDEFLKEDDNE